MSTPPLPPAPSPYTPPTSGGAPPSAGPRLPWEERDRLGIVEAFVQTVRLLVTDPSDGFSRLRRDGDLTSPMLFGIIVSWICVLLSQVWNFLLMNSLQGMFEGIEGLEYAFRRQSIMEMLLMVLFWPIIYVVIVFIGSAIMHVCLLLVGATEKSETGFEGTLKVYIYATVTWFAVVIPLVGGFVGSVWNLVLEVLGFAAVHRTTQGRALVAVLIPVILCCLCFVLSIALFGAMIYQFVDALGAGVP